MVVVDTLECLVEIAAKVYVGRRLVVGQAQKVTLVHAQVDAVEPVADLFHRCVFFY